MTCKGQIAEQNANEHVLAIAPQGNLQMSPNFFWNFSHPIRMFLTLRQGFLTIFWIFQTGLMNNTYSPVKFLYFCFVYKLRFKKFSNAIFIFKSKPIMMKVEMATIVSRAERMGKCIKTNRRLMSSRRNVTNVMNWKKLRLNNQKVCIRCLFYLSYIINIILYTK